MNNNFNSFYKLAIRVTEKLKLQLVIPLIIFCLLLGKDPFSDRSLIPNFEPFPDSFHYILPARCLITQGVWKLCRPTTEGRDADVPPLYSIVLIPFFLIHNDPRMFFFANVVLATGSFVALYLILSKLKIHPFIQLSILLIASSRYHLYWFPSLAMAENLMLLLFLINILLLLSKALPTKIIGVLAAFGFYATKFAYAPVMLVFVCFQLFSIWQKTKQASIWLLLFSVGIAVSGLALSLKLDSFITLFSPLFFKLTLTEAEQQKAWFSLAFVPSHLWQYVEALLGKPTLILWDVRPIFPWVLSLCGIVGLIWGVFQDRFRVLCLTIILSVASQVIFISSFYAFDSRYILHSIYALLIGLSLAGTLLLDYFKKYQRHISIAIPFLIGLYLFSQITPLRHQLAVNYKYAESPWYYLATREIDKVVSEEDGEVILVTALPAYFFDFFGTGSYTVLPVSKEQEKEQKYLVYGNQYNYENLPLLYESLLKSGHKVYLSNYGLGNAAYMHEEYKLITDRFNAILLTEGCHGACNVFKLELKASNDS